MLIRKERPEDRGPVHEVHRAAFGRDSEAQLVERLHELAHPIVALVAEVENAVVGHVMFSPVSMLLEAGGADERSGREEAVIDEGPPAGGLGPLAVHPEHRRCGIGQALVYEGLRRCREVGWQLVFVVGDPGYYGRFGFQLAQPSGFIYQAHDVGDAFQVMELGTVVLGGCRASVRYHPAFDELDD